MNNERCLVLIVLLYYIFTAISFGGDSELPAIVTVADAESLFASGRRASVESMDSANLVLIPGISDTLSSSILNHRANNELPRPLKIRDWEAIRGIGKKKGSVISQYIF